MRNFARIVAPKRPSNYSGKTYNNADSVRDFFARKDKPTPPPSFQRPSSNSAPRLVQGENSNIKVTFAEDMTLAEMILKRQGLIPR